MFKKLLQQRFLKDSVWTIAALCVLNITIQFLIYPFLNKVLGAEEYGNTLFLLSIINIASVSVGISVNNRRMVESAVGETHNAVYNLFLSAVCILLIPICVLILPIFNVHMTTGEFLLFWLLACITTWRYYADVEFRLKLNYKGYFLYYLLISLGYIFGMFLFKLTEEWTLILLPGEATGLLYVFFKGNIFKKSSYNKQNINVFFKAVMYLIASQLLIQLVFNADRFVLKIFSGGTAVTIYYIASLMGKTIALLTTPLNSVIIGYLVKSKKQMTSTRWVKVVALCIIGIILILSICVLGSHILIQILYPNQYDIAKPFFVLANLAQIVYFMTGILTTILLRYVEEKQQLYITIAYVITFVLLVFPATKIYALSGFAYAILAVNIFRFVYVFIIMLRKIQTKKLRYMESES